MSKQKFYSLEPIMKQAPDAYYYVIFGGRSSGKSYSVKKLGIETYAKTGKQTAIIRRWSEDFTGKRGQSMFDDLVSNGEITKATNGKWTGVYYFGSRWFFCRYEDGKRITDERPFCYGFSISSMEHDKSVSYPDVVNVVFDEFLTRGAYLPDEFVLFMNCLSTIIRNRKDVKIFMLGNTVNKYCPYFKEMGLSHVKDMKSGSIDVYTYGDSPLKVAVEFTGTNKGGKASDRYFAFDNPRLSMITGEVWEIDIYPHCPCKYLPKEILYTYFIEFSEELLQCEIILHDDLYFTFIHRKTTEIKKPKTDLIYTTNYCARPNYRRKITRPTNEIEKKICSFYLTDKVFYSDNEVGEIVRNYLLWCNKTA